jgi:hypothetical protein
VLVITKPLRKSACENAEIEIVRIRKDATILLMVRMDLQDVKPERMADETSEQR